MSNRKLLTIANFKNKALGASQKFLDNDFLIQEGNRIQMEIIVLAELQVEYTTNGTDYYVVNANIAQVANGSYRFTPTTSAGDLFNVRIKGGAITTVSSFKAELFLEA